MTNCAMRQLSTSTTFRLAPLRRRTMPKNRSAIAGSKQGIKPETRRFWFSRVLTRSMLRRRLPTKRRSTQRAVSQTDSLPVKPKPAIAYAVEEVRAARFSAAAAAAAEAAANQQVDANATPLPTLVKALPTPKTVPPPLALGPPPKTAAPGYKPPPAALQESGCTKAPKSQPPGFPGNMAQQHPNAAPKGNGGWLHNRDGTSTYATNAELIALRVPAPPPQGPAPLVPGMQPPGPPTSAAPAAADVAANQQAKLS